MNVDHRWCRGKSKCSKSADFNLFAAVVRYSKGVRKNVFDVQDLVSQKWKMTTGDGSRLKLVVFADIGGDQEIE
jgi:hypothetical protein